MRTARSCLLLALLAPALTKKGAAPKTPKTPKSPAPKQPACPLRADGETLRGTDPAPEPHWGRGDAAAGPPFAKYADSEQLYATMRKPLA